MYFWIFVTVAILAWAWLEKDYNELREWEEWREVHSPIRPNYLIERTFRYKPYVRAGYRPPKKKIYDAIRKGRF